MRCVTPVGIALIALALSGTAYADPVQITGGAIIVDIESDFWFMTGSGFDLRGAMPNVPGQTFIPKDFHDFCFPCRPGEDIIDFGFSTRGEVFVGSGPATFAGQAYSELFYEAQWSVDAVGQLFPQTTEPWVTISQPFTLTGSMRAFLDPNFNTQAFATTLRGQGRVDVLFFYDSSGDVYIPEEDSIGYVFEDPAPVPEPATFLLFATGAVAIGRRAWKRRRLEDSQGSCAN